MKITKPEIPKGLCQGKIRGNITIEKQNKGKGKKKKAERLKIIEKEKKY